MFWNKKESRTLPELPPANAMPKTDNVFSMINQEKEVQVGDEEIERHGLPSFPDSPMKQGFSQAAIKDAITNEGLEESASLEEEEPQFKAAETAENWGPSQGSAIPRLERPAYKFESLESKNKDIFVKIDKFYSARRAMETTKEKLSEIDDLLKRIRETKLREEQELNAWEKEIAEVKAHIQDIVENIFEKIE